MRFCSTLTRGFQLLLLFSVSTAAAPGSPVQLTKAQRPCSVIVYPEHCQLSSLAARRLSAYIHAQTDVGVPVMADANFRLPPGDRETAIIIIDGTPDHALAARLGETIAIASDRSDAFHLKVIARENSQPMVIAAGRTPAGAKYAVYRLMRELDINDQDASVRPLDISLQPFIKNRSVALFNIWKMPIELTRRHNIESWPVERIERYIDMFDFYGFNAVETHDRFDDNYLEPLFGLKREQWRQKVHRLVERAHENGQQGYLRIWGHVVSQARKINGALDNSLSVPKMLKYFCVNDPAQRKQWEEQILDYYVRNYAGKIDQIIGHWCDPGVCRENGCDYKTPMELQMIIHNAFRRADPRFKSTFSLWLFGAAKTSPEEWARGGWIGYENDYDLINAGILDKEITISDGKYLPGGYDDGLIKGIIAAGHRPAMWTWYRADYEIRPSLHIHLHERLGEYFSRLPDSARLLEWHNIERNVHGAANTATYYVAGRLMWEPRLNVDDLLAEFLVLAFGQENASRVMPAYLAIESIRCNRCVHTNAGKIFPGAGTEEPSADLKRVQDALTSLGQVRIEPKFRPRLPLDISPEEIIIDLAKSLTVIRDYAHCRINELPAVETALREGNQARAMALLDELNTKYSPWQYTLEGRQEWGHLSRAIKALQKQQTGSKKR